MIWILIIDMKMIRMEWKWIDLECEDTLVDKEGTIQIQMLANFAPKIMGSLDFLFLFSFNELII